MESIGTYIKREREFRKISIEDVSIATRIGRTSLRAMEDDAFDELPGSTFVRGYLKAYAQHVGLDPADVLLRYEQWMDQMDEGAEKSVSQLIKRMRWRWQWKYVWIGTVVVAVVVLAFALSRM